MVVQRTREIGLRMALGAQRSDVLGMIVRRGLALAALGMSSGMVVFLAFQNLISGLLFHVRSIDPVTLCATAMVLLVVSTVASSLPAYRAARLDPMKTLHEQWNKVLQNRALGRSW